MAADAGLMPENLNGNLTEIRTSLSGRKPSSHSPPNQGEERVRVRGKEGRSENDSDGNWFHFLYLDFQTE